MNANRKQILAALAPLGALWPDRFTESVAAIFVDLLADENATLQEIIDAVRQTAKSSQFPPAPADIINRLRSAKAVALPSAAEAWSEINRAFAATYSPTGHYSEQYAWKNPITARTVELMGGLTAIRLGKADYVKAEFHRTYAKLAASAGQPALPAAALLPEVKQLPAAEADDFLM